MVDGKMVENAMAVARRMAVERVAAAEHRAFMRQIEQAFEDHLDARAYRGAACLKCGCPHGERCDVACN